MRALRCVALGISVLLALVAIADDQEKRITVSGSVTDPSGAFVPAAELKVSVKQCKCSDCDHPIQCDCCPDQITVHTNQGGQYSFSVPHGTYRLDVKAGSREAHIEVDLNSGNTKTQDIRVE
jgi:hypothetical protein